MFRKLFKLSIIAIFVWLLKESIMPIYRRILCFIDWYESLNKVQLFAFWGIILFILLVLYVSIYKSESDGIDHGSPD